jgi:sialic acid synthase SpsE
LRKSPLPKEQVNLQTANHIGKEVGDDSIDYLASIGMKIWKIPSGKIFDHEYLRKIADVPELKHGSCLTKPLTGRSDIWRRGAVVRGI